MGSRSVLCMGNVGFQLKPEFSEVRVRSRFISHQLLKTGEPPAHPELLLLADAMQG